jgi:DNA-binding NarL/FixJ family response regulator
LLSNSKIRVVIADDHPIVRAGLQQVLASQPDMELVGQAENGNEALDRVRELDPDVLVLDPKMRDMDGLAALESLRQSSPRTRILIFTGSANRIRYLQGAKPGCAGFVSKRTSTELIVKSIRSIHHGGKWIDSHAAAVFRKNSIALTDAEAATLSRPRECDRLTPREQEIVALVAQGYANKEVAQKLSISPQTAKNHLRNIFLKLGVGDRLELALYAIHAGLHLDSGRDDVRSGASLESAGRSEESDWYGKAAAEVASSVGPRLSEGSGNSSAESACWAKNSSDSAARNSRVRERPPRRM